MRISDWSSDVCSSDLALVPVPAWAQGMNQTQVDTMVTSILNVLTGPIAKGLAAIALVIAGHMFFFGQASKGLIDAIIIGCFIVFGAGWIGDMISGTGWQKAEYSVRGRCWRNGGVRRRRRSHPRHGMR